MAWQPISTAPKDGTIVWAWLYDTGIVAMRHMSAEEAWEEDGCRGEPADYMDGWISIEDPDDCWEPKWWQPMDAIGVPPGVVMIDGRWRDLEKVSLT